MAPARWLVAEKLVGSSFWVSIPLSLRAQVRLSQRPLIRKIVRV